MSGRATGAPAGMLLGGGAYALWGLLPLYLSLLRGVPAGQLLAHRVVWSVLLLTLVAAALRRLPAIRASLTRRTVAMLTGTALLIASNWLVYMWAALSGHVLEASLGYFINPLVTVALGMVFLGERLGRLQAVAILLAALGVLAMLLSDGGRVWIPLALAFSFAGYGLVRKLTPVDALGGLLVETLLLAPAALAYLWFVADRGEAAFGVRPMTDLLLVAAGLVTSVPLLMFAAAARRLPLATLGLLQYIAPTMQLLLAVLLLGEPLRPMHAVTFGLIWSGLAIYVADALARRRRERPAEPAPV